jgi:hypothetical protein
VSTHNSSINSKQMLSERGVIGHKRKGCWNFSSFSWKKHLILSLQLPFSRLSIVKKTFYTYIMKILLFQRCFEFPNIQPKKHGIVIHLVHICTLIYQVLEAHNLHLNIHLINSIDEFTFINRWTKFSQDTRLELISWNQLIRVSSRLKVQTRLGICAILWTLCNCFNDIVIFV